MLPTSMSSAAVRRLRWTAGPLIGALSLLTAPGLAQRPPLVGVVGPGAMGAPAPTPTPIGGLRTTPLTPPVGRVVTGAMARGWPSVRVTDAPTPPAGVVVSTGDAAIARPAWTPTYQPPTWERDTTRTATSLARPLLVHDVVCNYAGRCVPRTTRLVARWVARCDCFAFGDGVGRVWIVERR